MPHGTSRAKSQTRRFFYHSFPRRRECETRSETANRGWGILQSIKNRGLILAPEVVKWHTPVSLGTPNPIQLLQQRICFTELSPQELPEHSERFGPFALEFDATALRRLGALPVIYMPQALSEKDPLALLGPFVVGHLGQIQGTLESLRDLQSLDAKTVAKDYVVPLNNVDQSGSTVQTFHVPWKAIKDILRFISFERAPFSAMLGVTSIAQALFYPTDDEHHDQQLGYYRQREWRITADYFVNGLPRGRNLHDDEKELLLRLDNPFWANSTLPGAPNRRIDEAVALAQPEPEEFLRKVNRIIVPDDFADKARVIFGDRVATMSQLDTDA